MHSPMARTRLYIAGGPGGSSVGPQVHEYIAGTLQLPYTCEFLQLAMATEVAERFRAPDFAGGLVTMPHKRTIIPFLDHCDDLVKILGACNCVYLTKDGKLSGTNTDWVGIYEPILAENPNLVFGQPGMVYGAGGASRAAVYALWAKLKCSTIYVVNRDEREVVEMIEDLQRYPSLFNPQIVHVRTLEDAVSLPPPYYIVSTVPDFDPITPTEIEARNILAHFLSGVTAQKGVLLDMCYHPLMTRNLELAIRHGYRVIQGFVAVASQFPCQWKLWTGHMVGIEEVSRMIEELVRGKEENGITE
ncbi:hypothetical protein BJY01DRAFT_258971 [Aspergillus pseudoustus]|uniref:Shikimate dehydrogenase substrate binding N-terminal domain-containing protein n=1 Tax=Aspergillus pseudoustus TaxID=1810923 RepID=A0ABR4J6N3_9EURO